MLHVSTCVSTFSAFSFNECTLRYALTSYSSTWSFLDKESTCVSFVSEMTTRPVGLSEPGLLSSVLRFREEVNWIFLAVVCAGRVFGNRCDDSGRIGVKVGIKVNFIVRRRENYWKSIFCLWV